MNLEYIDISKTTLEEYKEIIEQLGRDQREQLNYIEQREENSTTNRYFSNSNTLITPSATKMKTVTKDVQGNLSSFFQIKVTFPVIDNSRLGTPTNSQIIYKTWAKVSNTYLRNISTPTYTLLDSYRTVGVSYTAKIHYNSTIRAGNVRLYQELFYKS